MRMKVEGRDVPQESKAVKVLEGREWSNLVCPLHDRRAKSIGVMYGNAKALHQRARILTKPLLARDERVAVMQIFHLALLQVVGETDVMMGRKQETGAVALQPLADRGDLVRRRLLLGDYMIEAEHHQRVGIGENALVDRKLVAGLIDALKDRDRMARRFAGNLLEAER